MEKNNISSWLTDLNPTDLLFLWNCAGGLRAARWSLSEGSYKKNQLCTSAIVSHQSSVITQSRVLPSGNLSCFVVWYLADMSALHTSFQPSELNSLMMLHMTTIMALCWCPVPNVPLKGVPDIFHSQPE